LFRLGMAWALLAPHAVLQAQPRSPTFNRDIAPLVFDRCARCHHPGGPAPFSLLSYEPVRQHATLIAQAIERRLMPPWKADPADGPFVDQKPITDADIQLFREWVAAGSPEGDAKDLPAAPSFAGGWQLGKPDLVVTPTDDFVIPATGGDVFRIFVLPLPITATTYVRGVEFRPGNARVVHHANIRLDRTRASRRLDEADPQPGYEGLVAPTVNDPDGHFLGWTPGQVAPLLPEGLSWRLDPGTDLVLEVHLLASGKPEHVRPSVGLYFTSEPPTRIPVMLRLGRQNIEIAPGDQHYTITDSFTLPVDAELHAVQPHAHYRARTVRGEAVLPDGTRRELISIRDWDFRWQHVFRFVTPVLLPKGTSVAMTITYDNSADNPRNPFQPPKRATWGQRSYDEMGDLWLQLVTRTAADRDRLYQAARPKMVAESIVGYEMLIKADPDRASLHDDVALLYGELGQHSDEIAHFARSAELQPGSAAARFNLGGALADAGRLAEAAQQYEAAIRVDPAYGPAHAGLGHMLLASGRFSDAAAEYREALSKTPNDLAAQNNLGFILLEQAQPEEALTHLEVALRLDAGVADAHYNAARALRRLGRMREALAQFREAARLKPDWPPALANLAFILSTTPDPAAVDGDEAVRLATRAVELGGRTDAALLDALAASYAAAGRFDLAVDAANEALPHAVDSAAAAAIRSRRDIYEQRRRYQLPAGQVDTAADIVAPLR
jgi:tetratricopeptide (TPR) repeat protein